MTESTHPFLQLLRDDPRYKIEAYQFVRDALSYAQDVLELGAEQPTDLTHTEEEDEECPRVEAHLTGQQLCQAIRVYAQEQFGLMAKTVLNNWGIQGTSDFGEIVYNLIEIGLMKKSKTDRREDFANVYDFDEAFRAQFQITKPEK
jgi:uncharacterized repeat protein (TIGR04138 family)